LIRRWDRTDAWRDSMSADAAKRTSQVAVFHSWAPEDFQHILDRCVRAGESIARLAASVGSVAKVFTTPV
jgi:hypothetical protein